jgi:hypothetical protein
MAKRTASFTLSEVALKILQKLKIKQGISKSAVLEMLIRRAGGLYERID